MLKIMDRWMPRNWNDVLALVLLFVIPALWVLQGLKTLELVGEVIGATIMGWTLVLQYYFRRAPAPSDTPDSGSGK